MLVFPLLTACKLFRDLLLDFRQSKHWAWFQCNVIAGTAIGDFRRFDDVGTSKVLVNASESALERAFSDRCGTLFQEPASNTFPKLVSVGLESWVEVFIVVTKN